MSNLSLREAVKSFDVSRPTLTKAINSGKLSGVRNGKGQWEIDPAELARVYRPREHAKAPDQSVVAPGITGTFSELEKLRSDLALAEARAEAAEKLAAERAKHIDDLRRLLPSPKPEKSKFKWPWRR